MEYSFLVAFHCIAAIIVCFIVVNKKYLYGRCGVSPKEKSQLHKFLSSLPSSLSFSFLFFLSFPFFSPLLSFLSIPFPSSFFFLSPDFLFPLLFALPFFSSRPKIQPGGLGERC